MERLQVQKRCVERSRWSKFDAVGQNLKMAIWTMENVIEGFGTVWNRFVSGREHFGGNIEGVYIKIEGLCKQMHQENSNVLLPTFI